MCLAGALAWPAGPAGASDPGSGDPPGSRRSGHFALLREVEPGRSAAAGDTSRFERRVLSVLENARSQVAAALGLAPAGRIHVIVYDPALYESRFGRLSGFRSAGFFDSAIHVRGDGELDTALARSLRHEYVHAALASVAPSDGLPGWLGEGLAEYFERPFDQRRLTRGERAWLGRAASSGGWLPLSRLSAPDFARFDPPTAALAYLEAFALIEFLARTRGEASLERLCGAIARGDRPERALRDVFGADLERLESELLGELR